MKFDPEIKSMREAHRQTSITRKMWGEWLSFQSSKYGAKSHITFLSEDTTLAKEAVRCLLLPPQLTKLE